MWLKFTSLTRTTAISSTPAAARSLTFNRHHLCNGRPQAPGYRFRKLAHGRVSVTDERVRLTSTSTAAGLLLPATADAIDEESQPGQLLRHVRDGGLKTLNDERKKNYSNHVQLSEEFHTPTLPVDESSFGALSSGPLGQAHRRLPPHGRRLLKRRLPTFIFQATFVRPSARAVAADAGANDSHAPDGPRGDGHRPRGGA